MSSPVARVRRWGERRRARYHEIRACHPKLQFNGHRCTAGLIEWLCYCVDAPRVAPLSNVRGPPARLRKSVMPKVLLVEDDQETASEIIAELVSRGFEVDWAATGIEGLDKARADQPDAMVVDPLLPRLDGPTTTPPPPPPPPPTPPLPPRPLRPAPH